MEIFYYPRTSRKIIIAMLDMFNSISVYNYNTSGSPVNTIKVPLKFGPSEKYHLFGMQMESGKKYYPVIPSMLLSWNDLSYDSSRAKSVNELRSFYDPAINVNVIENFWEDVEPSPYNYSFTLDVRTESFDHLFQILENILPFFNPTNHLKIKEFDFLNLERNITVRLDGVASDYPKEMTEEDHRYFNSTLTFSVEGYMYRPIDTGKIIRFIKTRYIYDRKSSENYSTSGLSTYAPPPGDYSFKTEDGEITSYTKVEDGIAPDPNDNIWDGGRGIIDPNSYVFQLAQDVNSDTMGIGEYPDGGTGTISASDYVFTDGTFAEGQQ